MSTGHGVGAAWAEQHCEQDHADLNDSGFGEELGEVVEAYDELAEGDALLCDEADELAEVVRETTVHETFTHSVAVASTSAQSRGSAASSHEEELSVLRGEKVFLEYRTAELQEQLSDLKTNQGSGGERAERDRETIEQLQQEVQAYRREAEGARVDMEAAVEEKRAVEEKLRSTEAVFTERKRNFDHIITIFGEEKKALVDSKHDLGRKLQDVSAELAAAQDELRHAAAPAAPAAPAVNPDEHAAQAKELQLYKSRVEELETMLGQSGLARQSLEKKAEELEAQLAAAEAQQGELGELREAVAQKAEDLRLKTKEISDLKSYVGRKSVQWEQFKDEATSAKKALEAKFDRRCEELDALQAVLGRHKEDANALQETVNERTHEMDALKTTSAAHAAELMSLLEEKEAKIEELTKAVDARPPQPAAVDAALSPQPELKQVLNRNKVLEDEVVGLKSLVFKLEQRSGRSAVSSHHNHSSHHAHNGPGAHHRTISPSQRSFSNGRMGGGGGGALRFPSPGKAGYCPSPTGYTRSGSSRRHPPAGGPPSSRGASPVGARRSTTPRGVSPMSSRRNSVGQARHVPHGHSGVSIRAGGSPMRKVGSTGNLFSALTPASIRFPPGLRKPSTSTTPLANRAVNLGEL